MKHAAIIVQMTLEEKAAMMAGKSVLIALAGWGLLTLTGKKKDDDVEVV